MRYLLILFIGLGSLGCDPSPAEVYESAVEKIRSGQDADVLIFFDTRSRSMLQGLVQVADETSNRLKYPVSAADILGEGMVVKEEINGQRAVVWVGTDKRSKPIPFIRENGAWRVRGLDTDPLWEAP